MKSRRNNERASRQEHMLLMEALPRFEAIPLRSAERRAFLETMVTRLNQYGDKVRLV
jgi:hypothetical protein